MDVAADVIDPSPTALKPITRRSSPLSHYVALLLVLIIFASIRIRLRNMPLERDEGEYAYIGQLILHGVPPYKLAYNMKLPGTYVMYAVIMGIFGQTILGIRIGILLTNAVTTVLIFLLGRRIFGSFAGVVAAATYALFSNRVSLMSLDGHATHFVALAALIAILLFFRALESGRTSTVFYSGLFYGLAFLMKQHGLLLAMFGVFYWAWSQWKTKPPRRIWIRQGLALLTGIAVPFVLTCVIMLGAGVFRTFWFWTFSYSSKYVAIIGLHDGWNLLSSLLPWALHPLVISSIAAFALASMFWDSEVRRQGVFLIGYALFSFLAVCPGLYFRPHYFILILPPLALLVGVGLAAAQQLLQQHRFRFLPSWLPLVFFVLSYLTAIYGHRRFLFKMTPVEVNRAMHKGQACAEAITVADYLKSHSSPNDQVAILGSEPEIFFYTRLRSASGYMYVYPLMEPQPFAPLMTQQFIGQIESSRPRFVVYEDNQLSWGWQYPIKEKKYIFDWIRSYIPANYNLDAELPIAGNGYHLWDGQPKFYIYEIKQQ